MITWTPLLVSRKKSSSYESKNWEWILRFLPVEWRTYVQSMSSVEFFFLTNTLKTSSVYAKENSKVTVTSGNQSRDFDVFFRKFNKGLTSITKCTIPPKLALAFPFTLTIIDAIAIFTAWIICWTVYRCFFHLDIIFEKFQMLTWTRHCDGYCQRKKD